jgi:putative membrane protein
MGEDMRRGLVRWVLASLLVVLGAAFPAAGIAFAGQPHHTGRVMNAKVIDGRDQEFLTVIRFANLWEMPMGKLATERGTTKEVKTAGQTMLTDHTNLNVVVEQLARKFGVQLPDKPKSSHQGWMAEISSKTGVDFDKTFATRLRAAHGTVFGLIAEVRAGTHNPVILDFATQANNIVMKHMTLLEKTGYVNDQTGHFAEAGARSAAYPENTLSTGTLLFGGIIFVVVAAGTMLAVRLLSAGRGSN